MVSLLRAMCYADTFSQCPRYHAFPSAGSLIGVTASEECLLLSIS